MPSTYCWKQTLVNVTSIFFHLLTCELTDWIILNFQCCLLQQSSNCKRIFMQLQIFSSFSKLWIYFRRLLSISLFHPQLKHKTFMTLVKGHEVFSDLSRSKILWNCVQIAPLLIHTFLFHHLLDLTLMLITLRHLLVLFSSKNYFIFHVLLNPTPNREGF